MDGRADYRCLEEDLKQYLQSKDKKSIDLRTEHDPSSFYAKIGEAKESRPYGSFVTQLWRFLTVYFIDRRHCVKLYFCYDKYVLQTSGGADAGYDRNNYIGVCKKDRGRHYIYYTYRTHC